VSVPTLLKRPAAFVPLLLSLAAVTLVLGYVARNGIVYHEDEGTAARVFQLLLVVQLPVIGAFAVRWLPHAPKQALSVLALQIGAAFAALALVYFLEL